MSKYSEQYSKVFNQCCDIIAPQLNALREFTAKHGCVLIITTEKDGSFTISNEPDARDQYQAETGA